MRCAGRAAVMRAASPTPRPSSARTALGVEVDVRADAGELLGLLEHDHVVAGALQRDAGHQAADAGADDADGGFTCLAWESPRVRPAYSATMLRALMILAHMAVLVADVGGELGGLHGEASVMPCSFRRSRTAGCDEHLGGVLGELFDHGAAACPAGHQAVPRGHGHALDALLRQRGNVGCGGTAPGLRDADAQPACPASGKAASRAGC